MQILFKQWLAEMDYLSIGHDHNTNNYDSWVLPRNKDNIVISRKRNDNDPEFFHGDWKSSHYDFKGRIDHDKKLISMTGNRNDTDRLLHVIQLLKFDYPEYGIWFFSNSLPEKLA